MSQFYVNGGGSSPSTGVETLTGNSGGAVGPDGALNINTLGSGSITIDGNPGTNTLTTQLTGLTNHNILVGAGTATITNVAPSATSGVPLISQGAAVDPAFGTAVVAGGGTGSISFNINGIVVSNTTTTGSLSSLTLSDGQLAIGSTGTTPVAANLTAGTGIDITNGVGSITIATSGTFSATAQTVDAVTVDIITITPTDVKAFNMVAQVIGYDTVNNVAIGGELIATGRKNTTVTILGIPDKTAEQDASLPDADFDATASAGDLLIQVMGQAGRTIDWRCTVKYIESP